MKKILFLTFIIALPFWSVRAELPLNSPANMQGIIKKIEIVENRVKESIIRKKLAFKEGDLFTQEKVDKSKKNLYSLGLFKSLEIESKWDKDLDGIKVTIKARDGWYLFPWPMVGSRGGERYFSLVVIERNLFKNSEGIMLFLNQREEGTFGMGSFFLPQFFLAGSHQSYSITEYQYKDGGFNSKGFWKKQDEEKPEEFGEIVNYYEKEINGASIQFGLPLSKEMKCSFKLNLNEISYRDSLISVPEDTGKINSLILSVNYGKGAAGREFAGGIGRIFGMGMAGIKEGLKPLSHSKTSRSIQLMLERSDNLLNSDFEFNKIILGLGQTTIFRKRSKLSISLKSGFGFDLPSSHLLATNRRGGLKGVYAREYRGDKILATNLNFYYPFFKNIVGCLNSNIFIDYAVCWKENRRWEKEGVGFSLAYRFWRFPLPFGFGYTYSFDDKNWQASFAVGGMF